MSGIPGSTRMCCLFGDPVEHSKSPMLHNTAFEKTGLNYAYLAFDIKAENIKDAVEAARALNFTGFNLTMPHKITVMDYLDKLDPAAELIKTVNTVRNDNGVLTGFNTDGYGMMKAFREHGATIKGKKMVLMGIGGAGTSVAVQGALDGLHELVVFSPKGGRSWEAAERRIARINENTACKASLFDSADLKALREQLADSDLLANCTPIGMGSRIGQTPIPDASYLHQNLIVQDAIYSPEETELLRLAKQIGCTAFNGLEMLFYQGAKAFEIWTGQKMPLTPEILL